MTQADVLKGGLHTSLAVAPDLCLTSPVAARLTGAELAELQSYNTTMIQ